MDILLIHPKSNERIGSRMLPPLWPSILKALTPEEHKVDFLYEAFEEVTEKKLSKYDLVAISILTAGANSAYRIGDMCKEIRVSCIMGGYHPFVLPEEAKSHCDSVLLGEAEYVWHKILEDVENGKKQPFYRGKLATLEDFPAPDLSIYNKYWFYVKNMVETVRGCPYNCEFCGATLYSGRKYRYKNINKIVEEIANWKGKNGYFVNTNLAASLEKAKELMLAIQKFNLKWWSACSVN
ncbi:MAG: cobalamin-dependent protein, partial [Candidatus Thermoplasmatota archaeon]